MVIITECLKNNLSDIFMYGRQLIIGNLSSQHVRCVDHYSKQA